MAGNLLLVNMIPRALSGESEQDSEPMLAVNPNNPQQIVGTALTPNPTGGNLAPIYVSVDGGKSWVLNAIIPGGMITGDITVAFGPQSSNLYASILLPRANQRTWLTILRAKNFQSAAKMEILVDRFGKADQPFSQAVQSAVDGSEKLFVGYNDLDLWPGKTSSIEFSLNPAAAKTAFKKAVLETRGVELNGPQVRTAAHSSGITYVAFNSWRSHAGDFAKNTLIVTADVMLVRDDSGASTAKPFRDLLDPSDNLPGRIVEHNITFPYRRMGRDDEGQQRLVGDLSIAVNPTDQKTVYIGFCGLDGATYTLHIRRSTDSGQTWSPDLLTVPFGINVALAVNSAGNPGLLYQQLVGEKDAKRWVTHFRMASVGSPNTWSDLVLCDHPAHEPKKRFDPYLGDYAHLTSHGQDFYGIFSASNVPDLTHFPNGVAYQRKHDFASQKLVNLAGAPVDASIDPFFFKFTPS
jgi:hypothetical protein